MACDLTTGRQTPCADAMGGIKAIYISTDDIGTVSFDATNTDQVETLGGTPEYFQYDLNGNTNSLTDTFNRDKDMGTSFFTQTLAVTLKKLSAVAHKELKLLLYATTSVVAEDYNGKWFIMGLENGVTINGGTAVSGDARGSLNGYTLTFVAEEKFPSNFLKVDLTTTTATISAVQESA